MKVKRSPRFTKEKLLAIGVPAVLIPGILTAIVLGWNPNLISKITNYYQMETVFPKAASVTSVTDGDTFSLKNGVEVRMLGIDAPNRGEQKFTEAANHLRTLIKDKQVFLEYDRYQDDKYGRVLAWVWIGCEEKPQFLPADYMHLSGNTSRPGLTENPDGCKKGTFVNEKMVDDGFAKIVTYADRGELKYERRLSQP